MVRYSRCFLILYLFLSLSFSQMPASCSLNCHVFCYSPYLWCVPVQKRENIQWGAVLWGEWDRLLGAGKKVKVSYRTTHYNQAMEKCPAPENHWSQEFSNRLAGDWAAKSSLCFSHRTTHRARHCRDCWCLFEHICTHIWVCGCLQHIRWEGHLSK